MKKFILTVTVDEDTVLRTSGETDVMSAVRNEASWMADSGIHVDNISELTEVSE